MKEQILTRETAELYLDEMLEAERNFDYAAYNKRWRSEDLSSYSAEQFKRDTEECFDELGHYQRREYIGCVAEGESAEDFYKRFFWRAEWEKEPSIIIVGIYESEGVAYLCEEMFHSGENNMLMLLMDAPNKIRSEDDRPRLLSKEIAEQYLDEIFLAEQNHDYTSWMQRWSDHEGYSIEDFNKSRENTLEELGKYISREYICYVCGNPPGGSTEYRYAWKSQYEKASAITTVGIYEREGTVYLDEKMTHSGDDSIYMLLLNYTHKK